MRFVSLTSTLGPLLLLAACESSAGPSVDDAGAVDAAVVDAGASDGREPDAGDRTPTWHDDVWPIVRSSCQGCHRADLSPRISDAEATHAELVGRSATGLFIHYVTPGDPELSYLMHKIEGTHESVGGQGVRMPPPSARPALSPAEIATIRAWIAAGARLDGAAEDR